MAKQIVMDKLPPCDFCGEPARYDSQVKVFGGTTWAFSCQRDWEWKRAFDKLGTGIGQRLVLASEGKRIENNQPLGKRPF